MVSIHTVIELSQLSFPNVNEETAVEQADSLLDSGTIDWDSLTPGSINLHRLTPVYTLAYAHHISGKEEYLTQALEAARSWGEYAADVEDPNPYTWHSLSITGRISALLFLSILQSEETEVWLTDLIRKHVDFLMQQENYVLKQNRGILLDTVLITAGVHLNESEFIERGTNRLVMQLSHTFPSMAAYHRNSAMHNFDMIMSLHTIVGVLDKIGLLEPIEQYINGALEFLAHAVTPLAEMTATGDSHVSFFSPTAGDLRKYAEMGQGGQSLAYAVSQGTGGQMPTQTAKLYPADGHAFFRSSWEKGGMASWLCLKSGFASDEHKHRDELSVAFTAKGVNVFIDPGIAEVNDVLTEYLQSPFAHNGIIVDNTSYPISDSGKAGMFDTSEIEGFPCARSFNNLYPGVFIDRMVIQAAEHEFYIIDDIYSNENHEYTQNFHLSNDVRVVAHATEGSVLQLPGGWNVCVLQHETIDNAQTKIGKTDDIRTMSLRAITQDNVQDTTSIQYTKKGKSTRFVTTIHVISESELDRVLNAPTPLNNDTLKVGGESINISARKRAMPIRITANRKGEMLEIDSGGADGEFLYTLLNKETGKVVAEVPAKSPMPEEGEYVLLANRSTESETVRWLAGEFATYGKLFNFEPVLRVASIPYIKRRVVHNNGGSRYVYELVLAHHHCPYNISWEITKDGEPFHTATDIRMLDINFTESGEYTCHYTVSPVSVKYSRACTDAAIFDAYGIV